MWYLNWNVREQKYVHDNENESNKTKNIDNNANFAISKFVQVYVLNLMSVIYLWHLEITSNGVNA